MKKNIFFSHSFSQQGYQYGDDDLVFTVCERVKESFLDRESISVFKALENAVDDVLSCGDILSEDVPEFKTIIIKNIDIIKENALSEFLSELTLKLEGEEKDISQVRELILTNFNSYIKNCTVNMYAPCCELLDSFDNHIVKAVKDTAEYYNNLKMLYISADNDDDENIKALYFPIGEEPKPFGMWQGYEDEFFEKLVNGTPDTVLLYGENNADRYALIFNALAESKEIPLNIYLRDYHLHGNKRFKDISGQIYGSAILVRLDEYGEFTSLTDGDIQYWKRELQDLRTPFLGVCYLENEHVLDFLDKKIGTKEKDKTKTAESSAPPRESEQLTQ